MMKQDTVKRFETNEAGASAIEFALLVPVLIAVLLGTVTLFDMFRNSQNIEKATFTVGDILSRQTTVSDASMNALLSLLKHTVPTAADGAMRVSSIVRGKGNKLEVQWSKVVGSTTVLDSASIPENILPDIDKGDSVILTETFVPHSAVFSGFGVDVLTFKSRSVHRPRFVSSISFQN
jgi:Flp pilus assembly protein TadG